MARDTLTLQSIGALGAQQTADLAGTAAVIANGADFVNNGRVLLLFDNAGSSGAQTSTIDSVADRYGREGDLAVAVGQAKMRFAGPFPPEEWNQSDGRVDIDFAGEDALTVYGIQLPDWFKGG